MKETSGINRLKRSFPREMADVDSGPASCTPIATTIAAEPWTMISNGKGALALPGTHADEVYKGAGRVFGVRNDAVERRVRLPTLRTWCWPIRTSLRDPIRDGMLFGIHVDRSLIGACLRMADDEFVTVYTHGVREPIVFVGDGWRAVVMPVEPMPTFDGVAHVAR